MKKFIIMFFAIAVALTGLAQTIALNQKIYSVFNIDNAVFSWAETTYDFGKIKLNRPSTHEFTFVNEGNVPLVISSVQASCGCTVAQYSKEAIAPGKSGFVKATFNAAKLVFLPRL